MCVPFGVQLGGTGRERPRVGRQGGAVLLEVIIALALFVGAAAVFTSGLSSSLDAIERLRLNAHAADLGVTVLSELQIGIKTLALTGPQPFDPPEEGWTWDVVSMPLSVDSENGSLFRKIEVVIRHDRPELVHRVGQVLRLGTAQPAPEYGSNESGN
jgi:hypothetical protein